MLRAVKHHLGWKLICQQKFFAESYFYFFFFSKAARGLVWFSFGFWTVASDTLHPKIHTHTHSHSHTHCAHLGHTVPISVRLVVSLLATLPTAWSTCVLLCLWTALSPVTWGMSAQRTLEFSEVCVGTDADPPFVQLLCSVPPRRARHVCVSVSGGLIKLSEIFTFCSDIFMPLEIRIFGSHAGLIFLMYFQLHFLLLCKY